MKFNRVRGNLKALFTLGFILTLLASTSGGFICYYGYSWARQATYPLWEFGQWMMLFGLANLFVLACVFFQIRKLTSILKESGGTKV